MKKPIFIMLAFIVLASNAYADTVLFACTANKGKVINVLTSGNNYQYSYGIAGKPELVIKAVKNKVIYTPWRGAGSFMSDSITFKNGQYSYEVFAGVDRNTHEQSAGVHVYRNGKYVNSVNCTNKTEIINNLG